MGDSLRRWWHQTVLRHGVASRFTEYRTGMTQVVCSCLKMGWKEKS